MSRIDNFEYLSDVSDKIDDLVAEAKKSNSRKKKDELIKEARELIDEYEKHIGRKIYNKI